MKSLAYYDRSYYETINYYDLMTSVLPSSNENLNGRYYIEVKDKRYSIHPSENIILKLREEPKTLRTQYQVQNETHTRKNQKGIRNDNNELVVENYPKKKQPSQQQPKTKPPDCPSCKRNIWIELDKGYYCQICEIFKNKQASNT